MPILYKEQRLTFDVGRTVSLIRSVPSATPEDLPLPQSKARLDDYKFSSHAIDTAKKIVLQKRGFGAAKIRDTKRGHIGQRTRGSVKKEDLSPMEESTLR